MTYRVEVVSIERVHPSPYQPRGDRGFDLESLNALADSIRSVGLLQPPVVRTKEKGQYELIAGERRYRASKIAGLKEIPVLVQTQGELKSALSALIENIQREDLNPIDTALALKALSEKFELNQEQMARSLGMNRTSLSNQLRLLALPEIIQKGLIAKEISKGHAKALLGLSTDREKTALFQVIIQRGLSVRETEAKVLEKKKAAHLPPRGPSCVKNIFLQQIKDSLQEKLGTKVTFSGDEKQGMLSLHYYNLSDLNRLLNEIGYSEES